MLARRANISPSDAMKRTFRRGEDAVQGEGFAQPVNDASHRLRQIALGFLVLLGALAVLTGVLGWDILPKVFKAEIATLM